MNMSSSSHQGPPAGRQKWTLWPSFSPSLLSYPAFLSNKVELTWKTALNNSDDLLAGKTCGCAVGDGCCVLAGTRAQTAPTQDFSADSVDGRTCWRWRDNSQNTDVSQHCDLFEKTNTKIPFGKCFADIFCGSKFHIVNKTHWKHVELKRHQKGPFSFLTSGSTYRLSGQKFRLLPECNAALIQCMKNTNCWYKAIFCGPELDTIMRLN